MHIPLIPQAHAAWRQGWVPLAFRQLGGGVAGWVVRTKPEQHLCGPQGSLSGRPCSRPHLPEGLHHCHGGRVAPAEGSRLGAGGPGLKAGFKLTPAPLCHSFKSGPTDLIWGNDIIFSRKHTHRTQHSTWPPQPWGTHSCPPPGHCERPTGLSPASPRPP